MSCNQRQYMQDVYLVMEKVGFKKDIYLVPLFFLKKKTVNNEGMYLYLKNAIMNIYVASY